MYIYLFVCLFVCLCVPVRCSIYIKIYKLNHHLHLLPSFSATTADGKPQQQQSSKRRTEKDLMVENGGAGVYSQVRGAVGVWIDILCVHSIPSQSPSSPNHHHHTTTT